MGSFPVLFYLPKNGLRILRAAYFPFDKEKIDRTKKTIAKND
jgi:hypothetical protein